MATVGGLDGRTRLYAFSTLGEAGASPTVAVGIPPSVAFAEAARVRRLALWLAPSVPSWPWSWAGLPWGCWSAAGARSDSGRPPSRRWRSPTRSGLGDAAGEVGELAWAFDAMAITLEARHDELGRSGRAPRPGPRPDRRARPRGPGPLLEPARRAPLRMARRRNARMGRPRPTRHPVPPAARRHHRPAPPGRPRRR